MSPASHNTDIKAASQDAAFSAFWVLAKKILNLWLVSTLLFLFIGSQNDFLIPTILRDILLITGSTFSILSIYYLFLKLLSCGLNTKLLNLQFSILWIAFTLYAIPSASGYPSGHYKVGHDLPPLLTRLADVGLTLWLVGSAAFFHVVIEALVVRRPIGERDAK